VTPSSRAVAARRPSRRVATAAAVALGLAAAAGSAPTTTVFPLRLTGPRDCPGPDCLQAVASPRSIDAHAGRDEMFLLVPRKGAAALLLRHDKASDRTAAVGPVFADPALAAASSEAYFSARRPATLYVAVRSALLRYDVRSRAFERVFDAALEYGRDRNITSARSSADDRVHVATLRDAGGSPLGCVAYREDVRRFSLHPSRAPLADCAVDASGRWLVLREGGSAAVDHRAVDLETGLETVLAAEDGAGGPSALGWGTLVAADGRKGLGGGLRRWSLDGAHPQGELLFGGDPADPVEVGPIAVSGPAVGASTCAPIARTSGRGLACFRLDGSGPARVVAPTLSDGLPAGSLDGTGRYYLWVGRVDGRNDAFLVKVPAESGDAAEGVAGPAAADATPAAALLSGAAGAALSDVTLTLAPQDTFIKLDTSTQAANATLAVYTWPDNKPANAVLMKFDLSSIPAGAVVTDATLQLSLTGSDATSDATYTVTAHKLRRSVVIARTTGYTTDGTTKWTANKCCSSNVPLAQADITAAYATRVVDKAAGPKTWSLTTMVREWLAAPSTNYGLLLNSDKTRRKDRYRYFASVEHADPARRPVLRVTYSPTGDTTPPVLSAVAASGLTTSSAVVAWTTDEPADAQVEYGATTAYGSTSALDGNLGLAHAATLGGLTPNTLYHYRVRSRDAAGNLAVSGDNTFTTAADALPPVVAITQPLPGATVTGTVSLAATATDDVGVAGVRFRLDGADLGAEDTSAPYSVSWSTTTAADGVHTLVAVARDSAGNTTVSTPVGVTVTNTSATIVLVPQDTFLGLDSTAQATNPVLAAYTWPDNRLANAIVLKFDLSPLPAGATVSDATLQLALVESDTAPEITYAVAAHKIVGRNPVIAAATGYTADGTTAWTPNTCCSGDVPLAQADISPAYDTRAVDKAPGYKVWSLTAMVQEWAANPGSNFGLLLNSDASRPADRYRYFASMEDADPARRPYLRITYSLAPDVVPPLVSAVAATGITATGAAITWTTNEASDSQVEYGGTTAYGSFSALNSTRVTAHAVTLTPLAPNTLYHYRVRSRDVAGNLAVSGDATFTTLAVDVTPPAVSVTAPAAGTTVSGTVTVTATATDAVGVTGVQFKLDGANLGAEDTTAPYSVPWNTASATNGAHTLTAAARDAAGNISTSSGVVVTVANTAVPWAHEPGGFVPIHETGWESGTLESWYRIFTSADKPINVTTVTDSPIGESKVLEIGFNAGHVGGGGTELRYDIPAAQRANEVFVGYYVKVNPQWQGHGSAINKMVYLHDGGSSFSAMWYEMFGSGSDPLGLYVVNQSGGSPAGMHENVNAVNFQRGAWHKVEIYQKQGASNNGIVRVWVNGVLAIDRSDVNTRSTPIDNVTISGIWGGVGDSKNQADYMRFDRIRISRPGP
jgi:hypothetical protein